MDTSHTLAPADMSATTSATTSHLAPEPGQRPLPPPPFVAGGYPPPPFPDPYAAPGYDYGAAAPSWLPPTDLADVRTELLDVGPMGAAGAQVKHRRRTTPEQLKVLEFWYELHPKPDNELRERLAAQLGMTKRNVQVWFQNRRAKMKGLARKEAEEQQAGGLGAPTSDAAGYGLARRASIANDEAARRGSIPYPASGGQTSPATRAVPSALHMAALRNARRPSVPNLAPGPSSAPPTGQTQRTQLLSSGPFTPPRVVSNQHQAGVGRGARELGTIGDDEVLQFVGWPLARDGFLSPSPLPNPSFSFGSLPAEPSLPPQGALFTTMQDRGRLGSLASVGTVETDTGDELDVGNEQWLDVPDGFDPDHRRASAPADLLRQIGLIGLGMPATKASPVRPSPLNTHFTPHAHVHAPASAPLPHTFTLHGAGPYPVAASPYPPPAFPPDWPVSHMLPGQPADCLGAGCHASPYPLDGERRDSVGEWHVPLGDAREGEHRGGRAMGEDVAYDAVNVLG
nr:hypothetical protein L203_02075 [Cryptococcus depauperatus CBS 7841]